MRVQVLSPAVRVMGLLWLLSTTAWTVAMASDLVWPPRLMPATLTPECTLL